MAWSHKGISLDAAPPLAWLDNGNGLEPAMRMFAQTPGICGCAKAAQHRSRLPEGHTVGVVVLRGAVLVNDSDIARGAVRSARSNGR
jgi:hypothetical protein